MPAADFFGFAVAHTHHAFAVANDDEGGEAEAATTLDHLGHAVNGHHALNVLGAFVLLLITTIVAAATTAALVFIVVGGASAVTPFTSGH